MNILNITFYKFTKINNVQEIKNRLKHLCDKLEIKGSILLSNQGINSMLASTEKNIKILYKELKDIFKQEFDIKKSLSNKIPFNKMIVKVKKHIIPCVNSSNKSAPYIDSFTLKKWLDEDKDILLLDVRNDYEISIGKFKKSKHLSIRHFKSFYNKIKELPEKWKTKKIVTYCTGGIRCEKGGEALIKEGFNDVYQLKNGILKYFEEVGKAHYEGDCFVFDQRVALNEKLKETDVTQCFACRMPLSVEEQKDERYVLGISCPNCFNKKSKKKSITLKINENDKIKSTINSKLL